jgi:enoyl-CoA hydratase/carnithine racemase
MASMFQAVREVPQPSVAAVFGFTLGGGFELALSCDLIVAADSTQLGLPEARVGLVPGGGGTQLLPRKVGSSKAKELIFTGRRMSAQEALALGLVARVVGRSELQAAALELARDIGKSSPVAVREAKRIVDATFGLSLEDAVALESEAWSRVIATADRAEGIAAFNEKREPRWANR